MGATSSTHRSLYDGDNNNLLGSDNDSNWILNIEKFLVFVWCDATIGNPEKLEDYTHTIMNIAHTVNQNGQLVHTFNEINACREFIKQVNNVCLIISGSLGEILVPTIHNLEQIHSIYIFCFDKVKHDSWAKYYQKIHGVYTNIGIICDLLRPYIIPQLSFDHNRVEFDVIHPEINSSTIDTYELCLIYSKIIKFILLNMDSSDHGKHDMINYCRNEYQTKYQIQLINDLEKNYSQSNNPIWWYTKNFFFQGIINYALRTHDLYVLCSMYRFIRDIDKQLENLYQTQRTTQQKLTLYFGQFLSKYDFDRLKENRDGLMCINQFLTANLEQNIALMFIRNSNTLNKNENKIRVLFQIHIDQRVQSNVSYANIGSISQFVHEQEYLISMSSIYRIEKIERISDLPSGYFVHLTLLPKDDLQYITLTESIREEQFDHRLNFSELGYGIKNRLHVFKSANKLFKQGLIKYKQELRSIILHYNMAIIYDALNEYDKSFDAYRCVLNIARDFVPNCDRKDDICLISLFSNMGLTYQKANKYAYAVTHAFRALTIALNIPNESILKRELESSCYYNLGLIHDQEGKFNDAKPFYEKALDIRKEYLPLGHSDVTILQRMITLISAKRSDSG